MANEQKLTDEQIERIEKALECCTNAYVGEKCPNSKGDIACNEGCINSLMCEALNLVKHYKAENEENEAKIAHQAETIFILEKALSDRMADIERANKEIDRLTQVVMYNNGVTEMLISEAIKKFAESLKNQATYYRCRDGIKYAVSISDIDNLLKEMDGESE